MIAYGTVLLAATLIAVPTPIHAQNQGGLSEDEFAEKFAVLRDGGDAAKLLRFFEQMPLGGDLHNHLSGAVPVDDLVDLAKQHGYWLILGQHPQTDDSNNDATSYVFRLPSRQTSRVDALCGSSPPNANCKKVENLSTAEEDALKAALTIDGTERLRDETKDFVDFNRIFSRLDELTDNAAVMPDLTKALMRAASTIAVSYLELKINPLGRQGSGTSPRQVKIEQLLHDLDTAIANENGRLQLSDKDTVAVRFIVAYRRTRPYRAGGWTDVNEIRCTAKLCTPSRLEQAYFLASTRYKRVVGLDLVGLPETPIGSSDRYLLQESLPLAMMRLRSQYGDAPVTLHAGESKRNDRLGRIEYALLAGADRIGHGFNLRDTRVAKEAICRRRSVQHLAVPIEVSLTSNLRLGLVANLKEHPFLSFLRGTVCGGAPGIPVTLNTDDASIFETDLASEFALATSSFKLSWAEVKTLARNSLTNSFAAPADKVALLDEWDTKLEAFRKSWTF